MLDTVHPSHVTSDRPTPGSRVGKIRVMHNAIALYWPPNSQKSGALILRLHSFGTTSRANYLNRVVVSERLVYSAVRLGRCKINLWMKITVYFSCKMKKVEIAVGEHVLFLMSLTIQRFEFLRSRSRVTIGAFVAASKLFDQ